MSFLLETERLRLVEFTTEDAPFLFDLMTSPGWLKWIGDRGIRKVEDARRFIEEKFLTSYKDWGYGLWKVELLSSKTPIGMMGFVNRETLPHPDIGFALLPQFEQKGYALEAATIAMTYGFSQLDFPVIMSIAIEDNNRSIQLLQKLGLQPTGEVLEDQGDRVAVFTSTTEN